MLTLADMKAHLRLAADFTDDDALLTTYATAAFEYVNAFTGQSFGMDVDAPASVNAAVLLLIADLYEHRLAQSELPLRDNPAVDRLLWPNRVFA